MSKLERPEECCQHTSKACIFGGPCQVYKDRERKADDLRLLCGCKATREQRDRWAEQLLLTGDGFRFSKTYRSHKQMMEAIEEAKSMGMTDADWARQAKRNPKDEARLLEALAMHHEGMLGKIRHRQDILSGKFVEGSEYE